LNGENMEIEQILKTCHTVAMVGASPNPDRTSNQVFNYLTKHGYKVIPVNPTATEVSGEKCYASLSGIPEKVDVVDIFRRSEDCLSIVEEAIKIGAKAVWMQEGVVNGEAEARALTAGLQVIMDHCMMKEHKRLAGQV
jgi:predicted CoA-binding protein